MAEIDFAKLEKKWQKRWDTEKIFEVSERSKKEKFYVLEMFPYPSGEGLHMGHASNYTLGDILCRFKIMKGFNVLHPMGYDSLGLPAENAAIKAGKHPSEYTQKAIKNFGKQQRALGLTYDWSRVLSTADPDYYKWDQWIFLKMLEKGLAYRKNAPVNWCSSCETVLANEQVHDGKCWRHEDTAVEIKQVEQWFFKTTKYADELLNHEGLDWPDRTKAMQKHWIGKSQGTEILFEVNGEAWPVFTTRPDTIFGVTFVVVSAQHPKLQELLTAEQQKEVSTFLKKITSVSQKSMKELEALDKEGVFTGSYAVNPLTKEKIPIYAGNFVVADYGSGMVMAVPAHDQRDFDFAKKYGIEIKQVIDGKISASRAYTGEGNLINSKEFNGLNNKKAIEEITKYLITKKKGKKTTQYKLRDWSVARQRYWGAPVPIIICEKCGRVPVPEKDLPVKLPEKVTFGQGNPLLTNKEWLKTKCPKCKGSATREAETIDTFGNSSWYFLRYCDPHNDKKIFDSKKANYWCPVDTYIGGSEHANMHLIYVRFYTKFLRDIGLINFDEPAKKLFHQGFIQGEDGFKMSKSRGNIIEPLETIKEYGADATRFFLVSVASADKDFSWSEKGIIGSLRLIKRIYNFYDNFKEGKDSEEVLIKLNKTLKKVSEYYESFGYRKATIELKALFDLIEKRGASQKTLLIYLQMLSPICPHITEELWEKLGGKGFVSLSSWPKFDESKINTLATQKDLNLKVVEEIDHVLEKTGETPKKIYVYVMPFEIEKVDSLIVSQKSGFPVLIFAVNDPKKEDPKNIAKRAKPGKPSIYLE